MSQLASIGLHRLQRPLLEPSGITHYLTLGDSISNYREARWVGGVRLEWPVVHKRIYAPMTTSGLGLGAGYGVTAIKPAVPEMVHVELLPGVGTLGGGLLTGLSDTVYRFPFPSVQMIWGVEPSALVYNGTMMNAQPSQGVAMANAAGTTSAQFNLGDPFAGGNIRFVFGLLTNKDAAVWGMEIRTQHRPGAFGSTSYDTFQVHGYNADAEVPGSELGLKRIARSNAPAYVEPGSIAQIVNTITNQGARLGRQMYVAYTYFENTSIENGCAFWYIAEGGWKTTDHMPATVGGVSNSDSKYTDAYVSQWLAAETTPGDDFIVQIQIGQNSVGSGDFSEGTTADIGNYKANVEAIIDRWSGLLAAAGLNFEFVLVATQNTNAGSRMLNMATALSEIAAASDNIGFFDLRGALIDGGFTGANDYMAASITSEAAPGTHPNQNGASVFASLMWDAIESAEAPATTRKKIPAARRRQRARYGR